MMKFFDEFLLAAKGILYAIKIPKFWFAFLISFVLFGTLMNLLTGGFASFSLMTALGFPDCLSVIWAAFAALFGFGVGFLDWFVVFIIAFLQGILIGLIFVVKDKKKSASEHFERAGIAAGLAVLGAGCPTCGTALLTPILGAIFAGSSMLVGVVSSLMTVIAVIIIILSLKKVGVQCYCLIESEKYYKKKEIKKNEA